MLGVAYICNITRALWALHVEAGGDVSDGSTVRRQASRRYVPLRRQRDATFTVSLTGPRPARTSFARCLLTPTLMGRLLTATSMETHM
jgi:hypothetical protein